MYPECNIVLVGHSLGGSLAQIVSAIRNVEAVTFNAFGTLDIVEKNENIVRIFSDKITNYCNPDDVITMANAKNHIGQCYILETDCQSTKGPHYLETFRPLENRKISSAKDLTYMYNVKKKAKQELEDYINYGRRIIWMPGIYSNTNNSSCNGIQNVSAYTRSNGTRVDSYQRNCPWHD